MGKLEGNEGIFSVALGTRVEKGGARGGVGGTDESEPATAGSLG